MERSLPASLTVCLKVHGWSLPASLAVCLKVTVMVFASQSGRLSEGNSDGMVFASQSGRV